MPLFLYSKISLKDLKDVSIRIAALCHLMNSTLESYSNINDRYWDIIFCANYSKMFPETLTYVLWDYSVC